MIHREFLLPPRPDGWTAADVLALPEEQTLLHRVELVDGMLLVSPWPGLEHQRLLGKLQSACAPALPDGTEVLPGVNVRLAARRLLTPDLVVLDCPGADTVAYGASDVRLAAEIVSPSTKMQDRILKRALYAEALIPFYLLVEPREPVTATLFALEGDDYEPIAKSDRGELRLTRPFEATLKL
jgi:Uma2 family endonuclease